MDMFRFLSSFADQCCRDFFFFFFFSLHHRVTIKYLEKVAWTKEKDTAVTGTWNQTLKLNNAGIKGMVVLDVKAHGCWRQPQ